LARLILEVFRMKESNSEMNISRREFLRKGIILGVGLGLSQLGEIAYVNPEYEEVRYYKQLDNEKVNCQLCFRRCVVSEGKRGFCRNRENQGGKYYTLVYSRPCALQIDPVEKEPAFHVWPGHIMFCTATASCNNRCKFCQNWHLSQKSVEETYNYYLRPRDILMLAKEYGCNILSFTYSEPTVFYEYMYDIAKLAKEKGFLVMYHTNGLINKEPLLDLLQYMDSVTVDLKGFTEEFYQKVCSSSLQPVLKTLRNIRENGNHLEVVNLIVPTLNDDMGNIREMVIWIKDNLGSETPLHFSRFFPAYKLTGLSPTPVRTLEQAREIALEEGIEYVYIGNVPGHEANCTYCPKCGELLIGRIHFTVTELNVVEGKCKFCGHKIPGIWKDGLPRSHLDWQRTRPPYVVHPQVERL
jgi:pyruvate formate lyase activating enzyme